MIYIVVKTKKGIHSSKSLVMPDIFVSSWKQETLKTYEMNQLNN